MNSAILQPVVALAVWTMIVWIWMYATRLPAMGRAGIDAKNMVGSTGGGLRNDLIAKGATQIGFNVFAPMSHHGYDCFRTSFKRRTHGIVHKWSAPNRVHALR